MSRVVSVRVEEDDYLSAQALASLYDISVNEVFRDALKRHIESEVSSPNYKRMLERRRSKLNQDDQTLRAHAARAASPQGHLRSTGTGI